MGLKGCALCDGARCSTVPVRRPLCFCLCRSPALPCLPAAVCPPASRPDLYPPSVRSRHVCTTCHAARDPLLITCPTVPWAYSISMHVSASPFGRWLYGVRAERYEGRHTGQPSRAHSLGPSRGRSGPRVPSLFTHQFPEMQRGDMSTIAPAPSPPPPTHQPSGPQRALGVGLHTLLKGIGPGLPTNLPPSIARGHCQYDP